MRQYLPPDRAKRVKEQLRERCCTPACIEQDRLAALRAAETGEIDYLARDELHTLWSDGRDDGTFENNHGCWDLFAHVE